MSPRQAQQDSDPKTDQEPASFEAAFSRLEDAVRKLETGPLSLDNSIRLFEEGMGLAKRCNELLSATELKMTRLQSAFAEQMRFVPEEFDDEPDDFDE
ncbi:MAG TPA: exodeoxyribonuclease VII small subunit [Dehalococcoidia bacterium]|jgi:exodeoxyribonuclease VII small subunit|nr:exodeoxyribonuclease VII small subunit [Dehalococcoidia bacterium]HIK98364.1 exodeoxyribonuclease VII small subunit [Dehalococcoidia bacterium]